MAKRSLDLGHTGIGRLFAEYYFPTLLSLSFSALLNVADGIFVGRGVGSDALAAVNVAAPVFMVATGVGLMLGGGASVTGAVCLSRGDKAGAGRYALQALLTSLMAGVVICATILLIPDKLCYAFGGSAILLPYVRDYLYGLWPAMLCYGVMMAGMFVIRLDGSPRYAMMSNVIPAVLNIILDYLFVFPMRLGIGGAAWATSISGFVGVVIVVTYFALFSKDVRLPRPSFSRPHVGKALRCVGDMCKIGVPALIGDTAISFMLVIGNYMFIDALGEDGVAAFSVACYLMPIVFMFGNSIAQSSMPIVSYNHGCGQDGRVRETFRLSLAVGASTGFLVSAAVFGGGGALASCFLERGTRAFELAESGIPLFAMGFVFFTLNIVLIGYLQSLERSREATIFMLLRGYALVFALSLIMPKALGVTGLWLTVPAAEAITLGAIIVRLMRRKGKV